jgi:hypothetical protein
MRLAGTTLGRMRRLLWILIPVAFLGGVALGYGLGGERTKTTTVVQVVTTAPPPPANHHLAAVVEGVDGACLSTDAGYADIVTHTFTLRRPGNGLTNGDVVGVAETSHVDSSGCNLDVTFAMSPNLGFFAVSDDNAGETWGPFDSHQMSARGWTVRLDESS